MEAPKPGNKSMRQTNAFLRSYYTDAEFRMRGREEAAEQREIARVLSPTDYEEDIRRQLGRMWVRDKKVEAGWIGPDPGMTPQQKLDARKERFQSDPAFHDRIMTSVKRWRQANREHVAETRRNRYASDEEYREKLRIKRLARTQRDREKRDAAKLAAKELEAA